MKVKMLVDTAYRGPLVRGQEVEVPGDVANRWCKNGIAEIVEGMAVAEPETEEVVEEANDADPTVEEVKEEADSTEVKEEVDYESMTAKELYSLCVEKGIEVEQKQPKAYYIEKLA